ncbi:MAG TPA: LmbE family protein, partial [Bacteroidia bacterium]|nr:LmbE family protein [Bacteroidia bacterium]
ALFGLRKKIISEIQDDYWSKMKVNEIDELILSCGGFFVEAFADNYSVTPGEKLKVTASVINRTDLPFFLTTVRFHERDTVVNTALQTNALVNVVDTILVPQNIPYSNPYWLNEKHGSGIFTVHDRKQIGIPENAPEIAATFRVKWKNEELIINRPVIYKWVDPVKGELYRPLEIIPPVSIIPDEKVFVFGGQALRTVRLKLKAGIPNVQGELRLPLPSGWLCTPQVFPFHLISKDDEAEAEFTVQPPGKISEIQIQPIVETGGVQYSKSLEHLNYDHIPVQTLVRDCEIKLIHFPVTTLPLHIGYISGAGDKIPECLNQLGYDVRVLDDATLTNGRLQDYDVIITGIRAYNTNERIPVYQPRLMDYVKCGGTLLVQYNTNNFLSTLKAEIGPYPFKITRDRVTDENAKITILDTAHAIFNYPNTISDEDFKGWVQERGIYFAGELDKQYKALLSMNDPGEKAAEGSLIVADYGKGQFIYTGLAFFRELPAGVPGAYRLMVNLLSVGKKKQ